MGNVIASFISGFGEVIGKLVGSPLDFLSGKSCSSACGSTWDLICYIENFCVVHLLKLAAVSFLFYIVLLFLYSLYKLGIYQCICRSLCKLVWACFATFFRTWEYGCYFLCQKGRKIKRRHKRRKLRDMELELDTSTSEEKDVEASFPYRNVPHYRHIDEERSRSISRRWRDYKGDHLRKSLRPRSHQVRVGIGRDLSSGDKRYRTRHGGPNITVHDIQVTQTSKFTQKGTSRNRPRHQRRKR